MKVAKVIILTVFIALLSAGHTTGQETKNNVYKEVDQMPEYPGGEKALVKFIANNVIYPEEAKKSGVTGKVFVSFIVDKSGEVQNARIARGVNPALDKESLRVVNKLKKFEPGLHNGEPVNVQFTLPINFALDEKEPKN